jgi:peptidoglycan hydrolase-like protein with peptidoglycan-binding domain
MRMEVVGVVALGLLTAACASSRDRGTASGGLAGAGMGAGVGPAEGAGPSRASTQPVRRAQSELKREGLYESRVDGIVGPETEQGIASFQQAEGLQQTARLDRATRDRMTINALRMDGAFSAKARTNAAIDGRGSPMPASTRGTSTATDVNPPADQIGGIGTSR